MCPSVRLSVTSRCCIETTGRIELVFGTQVSFHPAHTFCVIRKFRYLQKLGYFHLKLCSILRTWKISPRQVDLVVNNTRRRRSSLLTTPIRQSTSRGCLLHSINCIAAICCGFVVLLDTARRVVPLQYPSLLCHCSMKQTRNASRRCLSPGRLQFHCSRWHFRNFRPV